MPQLMQLLSRFAREEDGPTIVEYALMLVLVAIAVAVAQPNLTNGILSVFNSITGYLTGA